WGSLMRKTIAIALASVATLAANPALARDDAAYVGIEAGVLWPDEVDIDLDGAAAPINTTIDNDMGWDADIVAGYDFGMFRLEAEGGYKTFDMNELSIGTGTF